MEVMTLMQTMKIKKGKTSQSKEKVSKTNPKNAEKLVVTAVMFSIISEGFVGSSS